MCEARHGARLFYRIDANPQLTFFVWLSRLLICCLFSTLHSPHASAHELYHGFAHGFVILLDHLVGYCSKLRTKSLGGCHFVYLRGSCGLFRRFIVYSSHFWSSGWWGVRIAQGGGIYATSAFGTRPTTRSGRLSTTASAL